MHLLLQIDSKLEEDTMDKQRLLYVVLKEIDKGNCSFTANSFDVSEEELHDIIGIAKQEGFIQNIYWADNIPHYEMAKITLSGLKYLDENSKWAKAYRIAKEVKDFIKL